MIEQLEDCNTAVCYFRYSSDKKEQVDNSEKRQMMEVKRFCANNELRIVWEGGDKATSGDKEKPQLRYLQKEIEDKQIVADCLVVYSWDRLTRRDIMNFAEDVKWISEAGLKLVLASENRVFDMSKTEDTIILSIKVAEANNYLKNLSKGVRSGLASKFADGTLGYARAPFGFDKDDEFGLVPNSDIELVPRIFDAALNKSIVDAVDIMRLGSKYLKAGVKKPSTTAVRTVLRNTIYIGIRTFAVAGTGRHGTIRDEVTTGTRNVNRIENSALEPLDVSDVIEPVVDVDVFNAVQTMLDNNRKRQPKRTNQKYTYGGLLRCSCGAKMQGEKRHQLTKYTCPYSKSRKQGRCLEPAGRKNLTEDQVDAFVRGLSDKITRSTKFHNQVFDAMVKYVDRCITAEQNEGQKAIAEVDLLRAKKKRIFKMMVQYGKDMDMEDMNQDLEALQAKIDDIESKVDRTQIELGELLVSDFQSGDIDGAGGYLNGMMAIAKDYALGTYGKQRAKKEMRNVVRDFVAGNEFMLSQMIDELNIEWKEATSPDSRYKIVPRRITASWRITAVKTTLEDLSPQRKDETFQDYRRRIMGLDVLKAQIQRVKRGVSNTMSAQIIVYPSSGRYHFKLGGV